MGRHAESPEPPEDTAEPSSPSRPAGPVRRLLATIADMAIFCAVCALLALPVVRAVDWTALPRDLEQVTNTVSDPGWISHASGVLGMWIALWWCYFAVGWGILGATPGKWLLGLRIVDHRGRSPIGLTRAILRMVAYTVSSLTLGFGHMMLVFRADRRSLHDILAGTRVVRR